MFSQLVKATSNYSKMTFIFISLGWMDFVVTLCVGFPLRTSSLGRKFSEQERLLRQYADFAGRAGDRHTQVQRIYDWCHTASSQNVARHRFDAVRNFSLFAHAEDSGHEVPPAGVFGRGKRPRPTPTTARAGPTKGIDEEAAEAAAKQALQERDFEGAALCNVAMIE